LTQMESTPPGIYFLLDVYRNYAINLGRITILVGMSICISILFRLKFIRLLTLILAWWNLFTAPLIQIWWNIYAISVKEFLVTDSWINLWIYSTILILIMTVIRIYIIYILRISKAGYIFFKKSDYEKTN